MKIGINARTLAVEDPGGAVQTVISLIEELAMRDVELELFGHSSIRRLFPDLAVIDSGFVHRSQPFGVIWERTILPLLARRADVDVLYCPNGNAPLRRTSFPIVMQIHDVNALRGYSSGIHQAYRRLAVPRGARVTDAIVTVSEFSKREILSHLDIDPGKVHVVYNGVDEYFLGPGDGTPVDLPEPYILYVGAMNPRKNVGGLVEAFHHLKETTTLPHKLVLVGPENDLIFKQVEINDLSDVVTPGYVAREELKYAYIHADLFAFPSLYEGFGLPPLEAMACGTPVVAGNAGALPEVLGDAAEFVDPATVSDLAEGMDRVLHDHDYAEDLVRRGQTVVEGYTWESTADAVLETLLSSSQTGTE